MRVGWSQLLYDDILCEEVHELGVVQHAVPVLVNHACTDVGVIFSKFESMMLGLKLYKNA